MSSIVSLICFGSACNREDLIQLLIYHVSDITWIAKVACSYAFFLIQQFITRGVRAAHGSYFITTLHRA